MRFSEVAGQEKLKSNLQVLVQQKRLPHAMLFVSKTESGGFPLAWALTQYLYCKQPTDTDACGTCDACKKVSQLAHPDLIISFPVINQPNKQPISSTYLQEFRELILHTPYLTPLAWFNQIEEGKKGNISALECREIIQRLSFRSYEGGYKIVIMWLPEYLGKEGNILLKLIEEPTPDTILIFVTNNEEEILPTILSRTQRFQLERIREEQLVSHLVNSGISNTIAQQAAKLADGDMAKAIELSTTMEDELLPIIKNWLNAIFLHDGLKTLDFIEQIVARGKETQQQIILYILQLFELAIRAKVIPLEALPVSDSEKNIIQKLAGDERLSSNHLKSILESLSDGFYDIERNVNGRILFHALSLRLQKIISSRSFA